LLEEPFSAEVLAGNPVEQIDIDLWTNWLHQIAS
jgi:hypothetical protein